MERIGVFLSSHKGLAPAFNQAAQQLGSWIGKQGKTLVYGGSNSGLMEVLASSVKAAGGRVCGIIPQIIVDKGLESDQCDVKFYCADLTDRKAAMERESEVFVALPGGLGTLDEVFTIVAGSTIGLHKKRVALFNVEGCWDSLWNTLTEMEQKRLISKESLNFIEKIDTLDELTRFLESC